MTNAQGKEFRAFLDSRMSRGTHLTVSSKCARLARIKRVERILKVDIEAIVANDTNMGEALLTLCSHDHHGDLANAVLEYYEMRRRKVFSRCDVDGKISVTVVKAWREKAVKPTGANANDRAAELKKCITGFRDWLIIGVGLTKNSADQYKGYIKKFGKKSDESFGSGWFAAMTQELDGQIVEEMRSRCSVLIVERLKSASGDAKKTWLNWQSAFHRFEDYLNELAETSASCCEARKSPPKEHGGSNRKRKLKRFGKEKYCEVVGLDGEVFTHQDLVSKFLSRLKTQGRYYPKLELLFPTRLISTIFSAGKSKKWIRWLKNGIEKIRILKSSDGAFVPFSKVKMFVLRREESRKPDKQISLKVEVVLKDGTKFDMMTRTRCMGIQKMITKHRLGDVSIDHQKSIENVFRYNKGKFQGLKKLAELFIEYKSKHGVKVDERSESKWKADFFDKYRQQLNTDKMRGLIEADWRILNFEYELMDRSANSSKGKGR